MAEAAMAAGTALSAVGPINQGNADAGVANYNADMADQNAQITTAQGEEQARRSLVQSRKMIGSEGAAYGASGVSGGSAEWVMRNSAAQGELNALTIKNNAAIKSSAYSNEAALDRFRGTNAETAGYIKASAALLGGGGKMASSFGGDDAGAGGAAAAG